MQIEKALVNNRPVKLSRYGVFSGPYFPVFSPNTEKYGPEKTSYLDTFHAVNCLGVTKVSWKFCISTI